MQRMSMLSAPVFSLGLLIGLAGMFAAPAALAWGDREQVALAAVAGVTLVKVHARHRHHHHAHAQSWVPVARVTSVAAAPWVVSSSAALLGYHAPLYSVHPAPVWMASPAIEAPPVGCTDIPIKDSWGRVLEYRRDCSAR